MIRYAIANCILCQSDIHGFDTESDDWPWRQVTCQRRTDLHESCFYLHNHCYECFRDELLWDYNEPPSDAELTEIAALLDYGMDFRINSVTDLRKSQAFRSPVSLDILSNRIRRTHRNRVIWSFLDLPYDLRSLLAFFIIDSSLMSIATTARFCPPLLDILRSSPEPSGRNKLDCSQEIFITRRSIAGKSYISHCSNKRLFKDDLSRHLPQGTKRLLLQRDEIGLLDIEGKASDDYEEQRNKPSRRTPTGVFCKAVSSTKYLSELLVERRVIVVDVLTPDPIGHPWWDINPPPVIAPQHCYSMASPPRFDSDQCFRYTAIDHKVKGVLIGCLRGRARFVHIHRTNGHFYPDPCETRNLIKPVAETIIWIYSPLEEAIWDIWVRERTKFSDPDETLPGLIVETNSGKFLTFGQFIRPDIQHRYHMRSLRGSAAGILKGIAEDANGFGCETHLWKIRLGLDFGAEPSPDRDHSRLFKIPPFQVSTYERPCFQAGSMELDWYFSGASLDDVVSGQVCSVARDGRRKCVGIRLNYDASTAYLGQWRPQDALLSDIITYPKFLVFEEDEYLKGTCRIYNMAFSTEDTSDQRTTIGAMEIRVIKMEGLIDFWFGEYGTTIVTAGDLKN